VVHGHSSFNGFPTVCWWSWCNGDDAVVVFLRGCASQVSKVNHKTVMFMFISSLVNILSVTLIVMTANSIICSHYETKLRRSTFCSFVYFAFCPPAVVFTLWNKSATTLLYSWCVAICAFQTRIQLKCIAGIVACAVATSCCIKERSQVKQEAQLLLGDRAMRKHAKDSWNGRGNDNLGWMTFKCTSRSSKVAPIES